jgi:hypothetical protein
MADTLEQIRRKGLAALRRELGRAGMIRFLQQFEPGAGNYAIKRREWVDQTSLAEIKATAGRRTARSRKPRRARSSRTKP